MKRVLCVAAVCMLAVLPAVLAWDSITYANPNGDYMCPPWSGDQAKKSDDWVTCNPFTDSTNCIHRCCRETGVCFSSSCVTTFGTANDAQMNCVGDCQAQVECKLFDASCSDPHCGGYANCKTGACGGFKQGDFCLYDGSSSNFKVCATPAPGYVVGDPQFVGLRGQSYQVHGVSGEVYNIVSDADLQYNSRFVFLDAGECPVVNGKKQKGCFSHPGSYLGELGLKTRAGDRIRLASGPAATGFETVELNGKPLTVGDSVLLADNLGSLSLNSTHLASVRIGSWSFDFENSDLFVNQRVSVQAPSKLRSHGLLGQTWKQATYPNAIKYVQGTVDDYVIRGRDIFGDEFVFNMFN